MLSTKVLAFSLLEKFPVSTASRPVGCANVEALRATASQPVDFVDMDKRIFTEGGNSLQKPVCPEGWG